MTTLVTIFGIALIAVLMILLFKLIEFRIGRNVFLPKWMVRQDTDIEERFFDKTRKAQQKCMNIGGTVGAVCMYWARQTRVQVSKWLTERPQRALQKSDNVSQFLKDVNNHKHQLRQSNEDSLS